MCREVWDDITCPFSNFNGWTIEVREWISDFISHFIMDVIIHPCWDLSWSMLVLLVKGPHSFQVRPYIPMWCDIFLHMHTNLLSHLSQTEPVSNCPHAVMLKQIILLKFKATIYNGFMKSNTYWTCKKKVAIQELSCRAYFIKFLALQNNKIAWDFIYNSKSRKRDTTEYVTSFV